MRGGKLREWARINKERERWKRGEKTHTKYIILDDNIVI